MRMGIYLVTCENFRAIVACHTDGEAFAMVKDLPEFKGAKNDLVSTSRVGDATPVLSTRRVILVEIPADPMGW